MISAWKNEETKEGHRWDDLIDLAVTCEGEDCEEDMAWETGDGQGNVQDCDCIATNFPMSYGLVTPLCNLHYADYVADATLGRDRRFYARTDCKQVCCSEEALVTQAVSHRAW